jgi:ABC-2 type transport system ATP-binding protein
VSIHRQFIFDSYCRSDVAKRRATGMSTAVEAEGLGKKYGSLVALENLDLSVAAGEVLGVLGPNGAGKTTAIRILTTILAPTRGRFSVAGVPHTRPADIRRRVGVLPESAGYPEKQTGEEYLRYFARLFGHSGTSARSVTETLLASRNAPTRSSPATAAECDSAWASPALS